MTLPPHHRPDGGFRNPWPSAQLHGAADFLKWSVAERPRNRRRANAGPATFSRVLPSFVVPRPEPSTTTLTWVGHTSFLLQLGGRNILTDPIWSERASPVSFVGPRRRVPPGIEFDSLPPIDIVLISHDHYDHLDAPTVRRLARRFPAIIWCAPLRVGPILRKFGARDIVERDWWETASVAGLQLTCVPSQHFSGRWLTNRNGTLWSGWVLSSGHRSVLFAGDTALHPEFGAISSRCGPIDLAILPIGAYEPRWFMGSVHMNPEDCLHAVAGLRAAQNGRPVRMAACHWGTFKLTDEPLDEPPRLVRQLWERSDNAESDLLVLRHGETCTIDS